MSGELSNDTSTAKEPRRRGVWTVEGWEPSDEQWFIIAELERLATPRREWANARTPDAAAKRVEIRAEITRLHDLARAARIPVAAIAEAVDVSPQQLYNIVNKLDRGA